MKVDKKNENPIYTMQMPKNSREKSTMERKDNQGDGWLSLF
jgi:hypothetical protein